MTLPGRSPTPGQLALARAIADGCTRSADRIATVPAAVYVDPAHWAREKALLWDRLPQVLCPSALLAQPGMAVPHDATGRPLLITRDTDGAAHVFLNVCRHRGTRLIEGQDTVCARRMTCPYHAWTYDTTGQLRAAPNSTNFPNFDLSRYRLRQVQVEICFGLIVVNLDAHARPFREIAAEALLEIAEYAPNLQHYHRAARTERLAAANWKVVAENFNECYHCAVVHKTLTSGVVDPSQYRTRGHSYGIRHESPARPDDRKSYNYVADANARTDKFLTWWLFPLMAVQIYPGGIVNTYRWKPQTVRATKIEVDWWLPGATPNAMEQEIILQHRNTTFAEDGPIVDSVQRGLESGGFVTGPLVVDAECSSQSEHPILAFNLLYKEAMSRI